MNFKCFGLLKIVAMIYFKNSLIVVALILLSTYANANEKFPNGIKLDRQVRGRIVDSSGAPLSGASIFIKGNAKGVVSDLEGYFSIQVPDNATTLVVTFMGYLSHEIIISNQLNLIITLLADSKSLGDVVVVGYGTQKKVNLTGAVVTIKGQKLEAVPVTNLTESLAGRVSGVYVDQANGVPGIPSNLIIRSASSWNDSPPLYVIDGVILDKYSFDRLAANDIENISILKDAASASIYGSRATGGVILVTTKKGVIGKPVITYYGSSSFEKPTQKPEFMEMENAFKMINEAPGPAYLDWTDEEMNHIRKTGFYHWIDYAYQAPTTMRHSLNVSGGNKNVKYYIGGNSLDNKGFLPNLGYKKYSIRGNIEATITENLTASLYMTTNYDQKYQFNFAYGQGQNDDLTNAYGWLQAWPSTFPPYINGYAVNTGWNGNLVERIKNGGYDRLSGENTDVLMALNYKIKAVPGLSLKVAFSKNNNLTYRKVYDIKPTVYDFARVGSANRVLTDSIIGSIQSPDPGREKFLNNYGRSSSYQLNGQISYVKDFGQHHVDAFAVFEQYESIYSGLSLSRFNFPVVRTDQVFATSPDLNDQNSSGSEFESARLSYVGKANYSFANKYLFSASVRRDGSMLFAPKDRWGIFPSISAAWRISEETFFKNNVKFIESLKLRGSFGLTGNDNVGGWLWQEQYGTDPNNGSIYFGNALQSSLYYNNIPVKNLTWEKSKSYNYGIDVTVLKNLSVSAEFWTRNTYDILGPRILSLPSSFGADLPAENYGKVDSRGFEFELGYEGKTRFGLNYHVGGNFAFATNKVVQRDYASNGLPAYNPNGRPTNFIVGLVNTGIIRTQADLAKLPSGYTVYGVQPSLGALSFKDISGPQNVPDGKIDDYDKDVISLEGNVLYTGGLSLGGNWKGLSLELLFQGSFGRKKLYYDLQARQADLYDIPWKHWTDSWTPNNTDAKYPRAYEPYNDLSFMNFDSDFWLFDASYIRLRQLTLEYQIPTTITKKAGIGEFKINVTGTNLLTWSDWKLYDPQLRSYASYPIMKTFTIGVIMSL